MQPDEAIVSDDSDVRTVTAGAAPQKFIRTYARDMAVVQKGGTPDLVPLGATPAPEVPAGPEIPTVPFTPAPGALPALERETIIDTATPLPPLVNPADAVVTTYEQGLHAAASRAQMSVPASPAAVSWQMGEEERESVLARLHEKAQSMGLPTAPLGQSSYERPPVIHEDIVVSQTPEIKEVPAAPMRPAVTQPGIQATPIAPPASPLSVPAYMPSGQGFTLAVPGESIPGIVQPPPPPPPPLPPPPAPPAPQPVPPAPAPSPSPIHTYTSDFSDRVSTTGVSTTAILAAQEDARTGPLPPPQTVERDRRYLLAGAVFLVFGAGAIYAAYAAYIARTGPVTLSSTASAPIFVDSQESVNGKGTALVQAFELSIGRPLSDGSVRLIYDPSATSSDASIFNELELPAPGGLLRNVNAQGSMAGVISVSGAQTPFFILSVASYGETFAGMLAWEPSMLRVLSGLYPPYPAGAASLSSASTTAPAPAHAAAPPPARQGFVDEVVANHDTRAYRDSAGRTVVIYGYWSQTTLVIARDEAAFAAILDRLASVKNH